jgi:hypothetical protein
VIRAAQSAQALVGVQQRVRLQAVLVQGLELALQPLQAQVAQVAELDLQPQTLQVQVRVQRLRLLVLVQDLLPRQVQVQAPDLPP